MATDLTKEQFIGVLTDSDITRQIDIDILNVLYSFDEHKAYASQIGRRLGYSGKNPVAPINLEIGRFAKLYRKNMI